MNMMARRPQRKTGELSWRGEHNSSREKYRRFNHGTSFHGLGIKRNPAQRVSLQVY
jgi:hypothetical protein